MRSQWKVCGSGVTAAIIVLSLSSCQSTRPDAVPGAPRHPEVATRMDSAARPAPLILSANEGERRVRRVLGGAPLIIKVDRRNGGAPEFVMGYEEIPPGQVIPAHRHPGADEIIFVHRGTGAAELGNQSAAVGPGATIYIPRSTRITLRNTGAEPLVIVFFFSQPGFEEYLRDTSVPEGQPTTPLSSAELAAIRERHRAHAVYERP